MEVESIVQGMNGLSLEDSGEEYMSELKMFYDQWKRQIKKCHPTTLEGFNGISFRELQALYSIYKNRYVDISIADFRNRVFFHQRNIYGTSLWYINHIDMREVAANIPEQIGDITMLDTLKYSWNELIEVPSSLWTLSYLQYLDLSHNCLESIPDAVCNLTLISTLLLDHNSIKTVCTSLYDLPKLRYIDLSYNPIRSIPSGLSRMKSITVLRLHHTYMRSYPTEAESIVGLIQEELRADYNSTDISWRLP